MFNLNSSSQECTSCIKKYKKKHSLEIGSKFELPCSGIPNDFVTIGALAGLNSANKVAAESLLDPVLWAKEMLDWHCLDLDGSVWKRKNPNEYHTWVSENPGKSIEGHSRYHRPYQSLMLRCTSKKKVTRIGRQCLTETAKILLKNGSTKSIKDIKIGDEVVSYKDDKFINASVTGQWESGVKKTFRITTEFGRSIDCSSNHQFYILNKNKDIRGWVSIDEGLAKGLKIALPLFTVLDKFHLTGQKTEGEIVWADIESVEELKEEETYDIEVLGPANFIANGILTHNCGKTESMVINMLFHLFTSPGKDSQEGEEGFVAVLVTPYQSQIDLIFKRVEELIRSSKGLSKSIKRLVKSPFYQLELHNGSMLKGFTASSKSGGNAESVRGQHADMLVLDETDYLNSGDIDAVMSVVTNSPNATIIASSTPSGKRERFYGLCKSPYWKEFHYSSHENPLFTEKVDRQFRDQLTSLGYKKEILAEFSEEEEGVFQNVFIQNAKRDYEYGFHSYNSSWTYTIGVDWNDTANGTTINVLGFNPLKNIFTIVSRHVVSKEGWTQLSACNKIAELNRAWRPLSIYIDAGYGGAQYEILKKYGHDAMIDPTKGPNHQDAKLREIVKQYDFGSNIEVRDLFDKTIIKKAAKPFLVESTVRRFETGDIVFPESDESLEQQLSSYVIHHVTQSGRPVYKARTKEIGDHALDALMLSVVAFVLEATPFGKPSYENEVKFTGYFGEGSEEEQGLQFSSKERLKFKNKIQEHKPTLERALELKDTTILKNSPSLPASNTSDSFNDKKDLKLWSWKGFLKDQPMPLSKPSMFRNSSASKRRTQPIRKKSW